MNLAKPDYRRACEKMKGVVKCGFWIHCFPKKINFMSEFDMKGQVSLGTRSEKADPRCSI